MQYRTLGHTDIDVSTICLGCWALVGEAGGNWGEQDRDESRRTAQAALDAGITFFDTAEGYGNGESEALIGEVLAPHREEVVIATKVSRGNLRPEGVKAACHASLQRLRTDHIDLYQVHWPNPEVPLADTFGALSELKHEGKVRAIGVSNFGATYLAERKMVSDTFPSGCLTPFSSARMASNQVCYSLLFRAIEHAVQPLCAEGGIGILPYSPLAQGLLTGKFRTIDDVPEARRRTRHFSKDRPGTRHSEPGCEDLLFAAISRIREVCDGLGTPMNQVALAWLLAQDAVTSVIAGARHAQQAIENARAADLSLPPDALAALDDATRPVKDRLGPNIDPWQTDSRAER